MTSICARGTSLTPEAAKPPKHHICPQCKERRGVDILYGMPSREAFEMEQRGDLAVGGCCVEDGAPERRCLACGHEWRIRRRAGLD